jgi:hypothetical protein
MIRKDSQNAPGLRLWNGYRRRSSIRTDVLAWARWICLALDAAQANRAAGYRDKRGCARESTAPRAKLNMTRGIIQGFPNPRSMMAYFRAGPLELPSSRRTAAICRQKPMMV